MAASNEKSAYCWCRTPAQVVGKKKKSLFITDQVKWNCTLSVRKIRFQTRKAGFPLARLTLTCGLKNASEAPVEEVSIHLKHLGQQERQSLPTMVREGELMLSFVSMTYGRRLNCGKWKWLQAISLQLCPFASVWSLTRTKRREWFTTAASV